MESKKYYEYFYGNKISEEGLKNGRIDYACLSKAFDCVLNNTIIDCEVDFWEVVNGSLFDGYYWNNFTGEELTEEQYQELTEEEQNECKYNERDFDIFQYFIISNNGAEILQELTNEIVFYNSKLDCYLWGVCHWGTSWAYVLTDIPCKVCEE